MVHLRDKLTDFLYFIINFCVLNCPQVKQKNAINTIELLKT